MMMNQVIQVVLIMTKMMTKSPKNDFKIESPSSRSSLITNFMRRNQENSRIKRSLISRFKRRNQEGFTREVLKRFFTNFERILNTRRAEHFCYALFPLFIGEKREVVAGYFHQKAPPSVGTPWKVRVGLVAI